MQQDCEQCKHNWSLWGTDGHLDESYGLPGMAGLCETANYELDSGIPLGLRSSHELPVTITISLTFLGKCNDRESLYNAGNTASTSCEPF